MSPHARATLRLVLGVAQMTGAALSAALLLFSGVNKVSLGVAMATCFLTGLSVTLFGRRRDTTATSGNHSR